MTNARKPLLRSGKRSFATSLVLLLSLWVSAAACVDPPRVLPGSAPHNDEVQGKELWKFETGG